MRCSRGREALAPDACRCKMAAGSPHPSFRANRHAKPLLRRCARSSAFRNTPRMPSPHRRIRPGSLSTWMPIPPRPWRVAPIKPPIASAWAKPGESASGALDAGSKAWRARPTSRGSGSCSNGPRKATKAGSSGGKSGSLPSSIGRTRWFSMACGSASNMSGSCDARPPVPAPRGGPGRLSLLRPTGPGGRALSETQTPHWAGDGGTGPGPLHHCHRPPAGRSTVGNVLRRFSTQCASETTFAAQAGPPAPRQQPTAL